MRVVSYMEGAIWVHSPWDEVRPINGLSLPAVIEAVQNNFRFNIAGFSSASQQSGLFTPSFQIGNLIREDQSYGINSVEFLPHNINVVSARTDLSEMILSDLFEFLEINFEFRPPNPARPRSYRSTIIFDPENLQIEQTLGKWNEIATLLNRTILDKGLVSAKTANYRLAGIRFLSESAGQAQMAAIPDIPFAFERRIGTPPGENWLFSQAPLDTESHSDLLNDFLRILGAS